MTARAVNRDNHPGRVGLPGFEAQSGLRESQRAEKLRAVDAEAVVAGVEGPCFVWLVRIHNGCSGGRIVRLCPVAVVEVQVLNWVLVCAGRRGAVGGGMRVEGRGLGWSRFARAAVVSCLLLGVVVVLNPAASAAGGVVVSVGDARVVEGSSGRRMALVPLTLSKGSRSPVSVGVRLVSGSARGSGAGADFEGLGGAVTQVRFGVASSGWTSVSRSVAVVVLPDRVDERDESFSLVLSGPSAGVTLGRSRGRVTILDDDPVAGVHIGVGDVSVVEGDVGRRVVRFPVTLSEPSRVAVAVSVRVVPVDATGGYLSGPVPAGVDVADGRGAKRTVRFAVGRTGMTPVSVAVPLVVFPDTADEANERFRIELSDLSGARMGRRVGVGTILDDDGGLPPTSTTTSTTTTTRPPPTTSGSTSTSTPGPSGAPWWPVGAQVTVSDLGSDPLSVSWPAASDDVAVTGYEVAVDGEPVVTIEGDVLNAKLTIASSTVFTVGVRALDGDGNRSEPIATSATTPEAPDVTTSVGLIRAALAGGQLTKGESLEYRVLAQLGDERLPAEFRGVSPGADSLAISDAIFGWDEMTPSQQHVVAPYGVPAPYREEFIASQAAPGADAAQREPLPMNRCRVFTEAPNWASIDTLNARFWFVDTHDAASTARRTTAEKASKAFEAKILPELSKRMNREKEDFKDGGEPGNCRGSDPRIDVYFDPDFTANNPGKAGYAGSYDAWYPSAAAIFLQANRPSNETIMLLTHEFMHLCQFLYKHTVKEPEWSSEGSADWAIDKVYPAGIGGLQLEHNSIRPMAITAPIDKLADPYSAVTFWRALTGPGNTQDAWLPTYYGLLQQHDALDALRIAAKVPDSFPQVALRYWNDPAVPQTANLADWDRYPRLMSTKTSDWSDLPEIDTTPEDFPLEGHFQGGKLDYLTADYAHITHIPASAHKLTITSPFDSSSTGTLQIVYRTPDGWQQPLTIDSEKSFCRDRPAGNVLEVILVASNYSTDTTSTALTYTKGKVTLGPVCSEVPQSFVVSASVSSKFSSPEGPGELSASWTSTYDLISLHSHVGLYSAAYESGDASGSQSGFLTLPCGESLSATGLLSHAGAQIAFSWNPLTGVGSYRILQAGTYVIMTGNSCPNIFGERFPMEVNIPIGSDPWDRNVTGQTPPGVITGNGTIDAVDIWGTTTSHNTWEWTMTPTY